MSLIVLVLCDFEFETETEIWYESPEGGFRTPGGSVSSDLKPGRGVESQPKSKERRGEKGREGEKRRW